MLLRLARWLLEWLVLLTLAVLLGMGIARGWQAIMRELPIAEPYCELIPCSRS